MKMIMAPRTPIPLSRLMSQASKMPPARVSRAMMVMIRRNLVKYWGLGLTLWACISRNLLL
ncbi:MAG TPA: hypothetical protein EYH32_03505, partial [Anaerolineae bacterium]|nr:hypothetical protein [Anaerolineae bacterium]